MLQDPLAKKLSLWCFQIAGVLLILLVPDNVLDESPFLAIITNFISGIVPSIDKWVSHSSFPQVTKVFFTYCWISIPFQTIIISRHKTSEDRFVQGWCKDPRTRYWRSILLFLFNGSIFFLYFYFALPEEKSCTSLCVHLTKTVQGLFGVIAAISISTLIALIIWWIKNFKIIFLLTQKRE